MDFLFSYLVLAEIYLLAALSTNLLVGIVGIFSVSQACVVGVGAYIVAALTLNGILPFAAALALAALAGVMLNILVGQQNLWVVSGSGSLPSV